MEQKREWLQFDSEQNLVFCIDCNDMTQEKLRKRGNFVVKISNSRVLKLALAPSSSKLSWDVVARLLGTTVNQNK